MNADRWMVAGLGVLAAAVVAGIVALVVFEFKHPCLEYETYDCETTFCSVYMYNSAAKATSCVVWSTRPDTCRRCLRRKP